jgi:two-component system phosphate regulon sensor histidine kinase PhoR
VLRSRFFWKLYTTYVVLVLVTSAGIGALVTRQLQATLNADIEDSLMRATLLMAPHAAEAFRGESLSDIQSETVALGDETLTRITLILPDGVVIADSDQSPALMENHGDRPEIIEAATEQYGVARRFSRTLQQSLLYVAHAIRDGGIIIGYVRASIPLATVDARIAALRSTILFGAGVAIVVALALGLVVAQRITSPLTEMTEVAESMRRGEYDRRVRSQSADEIGVLGETLNQLSGELSRRLASLTQERAQLGAMVAGMQEGVLAVDHEGHVVFSNEAVRRLLGVAEDELRDGVVWKLTRLPQLTELLRRTSRERLPTHEEITLARNIGDIVLDARATPFETDHQQGVVVVLYDITNLRRLERIRTDFVANVSHELKTPLTSISGFVETLLAGAIHDEENNVRFLGKIDDQVGRLISLVGDLLSLARIESAAGALPVLALDWKPIISSSMRRHAQAMEDKRIECVLDLPAESVVVVGDEEAMTQILDNLLDNAIKYTPAGGTITLRLRRDGSRASLAVEDSGIGIPSKDFERIFERFYRVDKARSRELGGTGLGLSIVKHLVRTLHGEIEVESSLGEGSCFTVSLPTPS